MSAALAIDVKGWCPGALRPMPSGDGLLVRVRPWCGAFTLGQASGLADVAGRLGNSHIDLTRRANLQIRGLRERGLPELHAALAKLDLLDPDPETEAARNIMVGPLAGLDPAEGLDVRPIARAIARALAADRRYSALPAKFGWLVDGGGTVSIAGERADIALVAAGEKIALGLDGHWLGATMPEEAVAVALAAAHAFVDLGMPGRVRDLPEGDFARLCSAVAPKLLAIGRIPSTGGRLVGLRGTVVGVVAPFGRLEASQLHGLVTLAAEAGATELRLSPWRTLYVGTRDGRALIDGAGKLGLIVAADDPLLRIEACPGAPACKSSRVDTRRDARRLASLGFKGSLHISGCAKGCARSAPADLVLVGEQGHYGVIRNGTARDMPERTVDASELLDV
ncbi:MAG: precorrin-3B synthase [Reyranellales bacterium]